MSAGISGTEARRPNRLTQPIWYLRRTARPGRGRIIPLARPGEAFPVLVPGSIGANFGTTYAPVGGTSLGESVSSTSTIAPTVKSHSRELGFHLLILGFKRSTFCLETFYVATRDSLLRDTVGSSALGSVLDTWRAATWQTVTPDFANLNE